MTAPDRAKLPIFAIGHRHRLLPLLITLPGTEGDQLPKAVNIEVIVSVKVAPQPIVPDVSPLRASVDDATSALLPPMAQARQCQPRCVPELGGDAAQPPPTAPSAKPGPSLTPAKSATQPKQSLLSKKSLLARTKPGKPLFNVAA